MMTLNLLIHKTIPIVLCRVTSISGQSEAVVLHDKTNERRQGERVILGTDEMIKKLYIEYNISYPKETK